MGSGTERWLGTDQGLGRCRDCWGQGSGVSDSGLDLGIAAVASHGEENAYRLHLCCCFVVINAPMRDP